MVKECQNACTLLCFVQNGLGKTFNADCGAWKKKKQITLHVNFQLKYLQKHVAFLHIKKYLS